MLPVVGVFSCLMGVFGTVQWNGLGLSMALPAGPARGAAGEAVDIKGLLNLDAFIKGLLHLQINIIINIISLALLPVLSSESSPVLWCCRSALVWLFSPPSCSPSEPVWAEELVLIGDRGMSGIVIRLPVVPPPPMPDDTMLLPMCDAVISKLSLIFSCFSGLTEPAPGFAGSSSIWNWLSGV